MIFHQTRRSCYVRRHVRAIRMMSHFRPFGPISHFPRHFPLPKLPFFRLVARRGLAEAPAHMDGMHFYQRLPLFGTGLALGIWLVALHVFMLAKPMTAQGVLKRFPRNH